MRYTVCNTGPSTQKSVIKSVINLNREIRDYVTDVCVTDIHAYTSHDHVALSCTQMNYALPKDARLPTTRVHHALAAAHARASLSAPCAPAHTARDCGTSGNILDQADVVLARSALSWRRSTPILTTTMN